MLSAAIGHVEVTKLLLAVPGIEVNAKSNVSSANLANLCHDDHHVV